jgi:hypothetical protein
VSIIKQFYNSWNSGQITLLNDSFTAEKSRVLTKKDENSQNTVF